MGVLSKFTSHFVFMLCMIITALPAYASEDKWAPELHFTIENGTYTETLIFISGLMYAMSYSDIALIKQGKENFFCAPESIKLDSKLAVEILNKKLKGPNTSETITETLVTQLRNEFECEK